METAKGWAIDSSTGKPILTFEKCSVIQDRQAYFVLRAISKISARKPCVICGCGYSQMPEHLTAEEMKHLMITLKIRQKDIAVALNLRPAKVTDAFTGRQKHTRTLRLIEAYLRKRLIET